MFIMFINYYQHYNSVVVVSVKTKGYISQYAKLNQAIHYSKLSQ